MDGLPPVTSRTEDSLSGARGILRAVGLSAVFWIAALTTVYALWQ